VITERQTIIDLIQEAFNHGARLPRCCEEANISLRTYRRWYHQGVVQSDQRSQAVRPAPTHQLTEQEKQRIIAIANQPEYADLPPSQIVPRLLDQAIYIGSESSFYRVLKAHQQLNHRGRSQAPKPSNKPTSFTATGPNQVWSWDITYLGSPIKGQFYYLYLFLDIYSRKIVGYEVHEQESGQQAADLLQRCQLSEQCLKAPIVLHSDNGAPMKSFTMKAKMESLGVTSSFSRPRVSNDNPYSESLFRTLKYRPEWPSSGFADLSAARDWVEQFSEWYNEAHRHSGLNFVTPSQRHCGEDAELLAQRKVILEKAKAVNPLRWSGETRNCVPIGSVTLNPDKEITPQSIKKAA